MTQPVFGLSYVPAVGEAKLNLHLHMPIKRLGLHRKKYAYRCDWCGEVCGREGCADRLTHLQKLEAATTPAERRRAAREYRYLFTETEAQEILSLAQAESQWAQVPAQREPLPYPMEQVAA